MICQAGIGNSFAPWGAMPVAGDAFRRGHETELVGAVNGEKFCRFRDFCRRRDIYGNGDSCGGCVGFAEVGDIINGLAGIQGTVCSGQGAG